MFTVEDTKSYIIHSTYCHLETHHALFRKSSSLFQLSLVLFKIQKQTYQSAILSDKNNGQTYNAESRF